MKHLKLFALAGGILLFAACSKTDDNNPNPNPSSKTALIVDGTWKWTNLELVENINGTDTLINGWSAIDTCRRDDVTTLRLTATDR